MSAIALQKRFNEVFEYRDGALFWKVNTNKSKNLIGKQAGCLSSNSYGSVMLDKKHTVCIVLFFVCTLA